MDTSKALRGWSLLDDMGLSTKKAHAELQQRIDDDAALVARVFATADGQRLLELLEKATLKRPLCRSDDTATMEQVALYAKFREGQNGVVAMLLNAIDHHTRQAVREPERETT